MNHQYPEQSGTAPQPQGQPGDGYNQSPGNQVPNPPPPSQPAATPPQPDVEQQSATGLESQPVLSEEYTPEPDYQKARVPQGRPFLKMFLIILAIVVLLGVGAFFLLFFNKGTLKLTVAPPEAQVKINDKVYSTRITYEEKLPAGEHVLNITLSGYVECNKKIEITGFQTTELTIDLQKIPVPEKILEEKMEFLGLSPDKKYLVGLGNSGKTFYRMPIEKKDESEGESEQDTEKSENQNQTKETQPVTTIQAAQAITEGKFANIVNVVWNPKKELAILKIKNEEDALRRTDFWRQDAGNGTITTWLYDFNRYNLTDQESVFLGDDIGDITWTPDGEKIIYYRQNTLFQASGNNSDPSVVKRIDKIYNPNMSLSPDGKILALVPRTTKYQENDLHQLDLYSKDLKQLTKDGNKKEAIFNAGSAKILYSTYSTDPNSSIYTSLSIIDIGGKNNQALDLRALINKVRFLDENNFLYAHLEDQTKSEGLKKFNIETKKEHDYFFESKERLRFENMILSENGQKIYFLSEKFLYQLDLATDEY